MHVALRKAGTGQQRDPTVVKHFTHGPITGRERATMRIATFGDLHLGHTPVLDKFLGEEDRLLRLDDHLSRTHDRIILMGDIYQTDYGSYPGSRSDVLEAILKRYSRIFRRWSTAPHHSLFGNHDLITQKLLGNLKQIRLLKDNWSIWLTHGHQFDPFIGEQGGACVSLSPG